MYQVVLTTCPNNVNAQAIATSLVEQKLAACVNIVPAVKSIYQWQGQVLSEQEVMLLIKCKSTLYCELEAAILLIHPYDVPEIIALDITQGQPSYLQWLADNIREPKC